MVGIKYIWRKFLQGASLDHCATEVSIKNKKNLKAFSVLGIIMMSLGTVFGWIMSDVFTFNSEFIILLIYFIVMYGAVTILEEHIKRSYFSILSMANSSYGDGNYYRHLCRS